MKRHVSLRRLKPFSSRTPLRPINRERMGRKMAVQRAFYASPEWRAKPDGIRWRTFLHDDFTCRCGCGWRDITGKTLDADHVRGSLRWGGQEQPGIDTETRRRDEHRAKHAAQPWNRQQRMSR